MKSFFSLADFAAGFPGECSALATTLKRAAGKEIAKRMDVYMREIAPVGGLVFDVDKGRIIGSRDRHPGLLKSSFRILPGEDRIREENTAPHAMIIDRGRKRGFTPRGQKRVRLKRSDRKRKGNKQAPMLGSKQAPQGMTRPAFKRVQAEREAIVSRAIDAAEAKS